MPNCAASEAITVAREQMEQIFGLADAFLLSGVKHYVGTFWELVDEPSSHFAKLFYTSIARGEGVGTAIRNSREALIGNGGEKALAWANYMLYGDLSRELGDPEKGDALRVERKGWKRILRGRTPSLHGSLSFGRKRIHQIRLGRKLTAARLGPRITTINGLLS